MNTLDLWDLFSGSNKSIERLGALVADGHFISGASHIEDDEDIFDSNKTITDSFVRAYYSFAIPKF